jgi:hypothetical protein
MSAADSSTENIPSALDGTVDFIGQGQQLHMGLLKTTAYSKYV